MTWQTAMEYLCHKLPRICSTCRKHFPVLSSFMTYHWVCNQINTTDVTSGAGTAHSSGAPEFTPGFQWARGGGVSYYSIFSFICMFCMSLLVLLYFFFWPLCCPFFFLFFFSFIYMFYISLFVLLYFFFWPLCCPFSFLFSLVLYICCIYHCLSFVPFLLAIVLSFVFVFVFFRLTDSDYPLISSNSSYIDKRIDCAPKT